MMSGYTYDIQMPHYLTARLAVSGGMPWRVVGEY